MRWSEPNHFTTAGLARCAEALCLPRSPRLLALFPSWCSSTKCVWLTQCLLLPKHMLPCNCTRCTATGKHLETAFWYVGCTYELCRPITKSGRQVLGFFPAVLAKWLLLGHPRHSHQSSSWSNSKAVLKEDRFSGVDYKDLARKMCWKTIWNNL